MHASSDPRYISDMFSGHRAGRHSEQLSSIEVKDPLSTIRVDLDRQANRSPIPDISISVAARHRMLHSSNSRVHLPAPSSGVVRQNARRGRLQVSAAIKKGKEKNVVCTKTIVAKQDTVSIHAQQHQEFFLLLLDRPECGGP